MSCADDSHNYAQVLAQRKEALQYPQSLNAVSVTDMDLYKLCPSHCESPFAIWSHLTSQYASKDTEMSLSKALNADGRGAVSSTPLYEPPLRRLLYSSNAISKLACSSPLRLSRKMQPTETAPRSTSPITASTCKAEKAWSLASIG